mmetsp:Transcript_7806/g.24186  ORF Transcript_7806/g.24186 Transcript_7806/m.24186 type:complete len:297 (-) Transcript_7806:1430-2320(-)
MPASGRPGPPQGRRKVRLHVTRAHVRAVQPELRQQFQLGKLARGHVRWWIAPLQHGIEVQEPDLCLGKGGARRRCGEEPVEGDREEARLGQHVWHRVHKDRTPTQALSHLSQQDNVQVHDRGEGGLDGRVPALLHGPQDALAAVDLPEDEDHGGARRDRAYLLPEGKLCVEGGLGLQVPELRTSDEAWHDHMPGSLPLCRRQVQTAPGHRQHVGVAHGEYAAGGPTGRLRQLLRRQVQYVVNARKVRVLVPHGREVQVTAIAAARQHGHEAPEHAAVRLGLRRSLCTGHGLGIELL